MCTSVPNAKVSSCPGPSPRPPCRATRGDRAAPPGRDAVDMVGQWLVGDSGWRVPLFHVWEVEIAKFWFGNVWKHLETKEPK